MQNYKQIYAIKEANKKRVLKNCPELPDTSGIYILTRKECYVGQSKTILTRLASHLQGYKTKNPSHIDLSLKKYGLHSKENPFGWEIKYQEVDKELLNNIERKYISFFQDKGYGMLNKTSGGQDEGKVKINEYKPPKTYTQGKAYGRQQLAKELKHIIDRYLNIELKKDNVSSQKALAKFYKLLGE